ncbi:MAG: 2-oxoglutarate dehydrogenase E1 component, partial [Myxococcales bacterium]|nr:2-oxoglutarate dehydrogenase E1 component [Myxococcales bacterium]
MKIGPENVAYVEAMYEEYLRDPASVPSDFRAYFLEFEGPGGNGHARAIGPTRAAPGLFRAGGAPVSNGNGTHGGNGKNGQAAHDAAVRQDKVDQLIRAYRVRGHMLASLDPLSIPRKNHPELELEHYDLGEADMDFTYSSRTIAGENKMTLRRIMERLRSTYCREIGVQFMHIDDIRMKNWLQDRMERSENRVQLDRSEQVRILTKLTDAEIFEDFLQKKFLGAKRFSLEGGETLIPLLDSLIGLTSEKGVEQIVIGMAHRGRLNVLSNIMGKNPRDIFREFADLDPEEKIGRGDVKYHMGHSADFQTAKGREVHLSLCFNPSHLEYVDPVAIGRVRAKQDRLGDTDRSRAMGILIHGDAAFAGEGVIQETLNMSELNAYEIGGTIHIIVNNQVGFTTPPESGRSTPYATCVAKMLQVPIFHVNGEHPEAVEAVLRLAVDFRAQFKKDVVIDMYCYRKYGHNEGDDPAFTQPVMYRTIRARKTVREGYMENLLKFGTLSREECEEIATKRRQELEEELLKSREPGFRVRQAYGAGLWAPYRGGKDADTPEVPTAVSRELLEGLLRAQTVVPDGFSLHPKIEKLNEARLEMLGEKPLDWGAGEALAFASLLADAHRIRISGQDAGRGTFSHRHAVLHDYKTGATYMPLAGMPHAKAPIEIYDSSLSEIGPLGFEWGYSLDWPDGLVVWEAQFGDFANSAQVIIDQFIVSAEDKWKRLSGLVMLLPHGFEGQGPEHSSARLERFLMLSSEDNIQVVNLTTPAQLFHCLRRQVVRPLRKPLIVMSPKSLLRHPRAVSPLSDLATGSFQRIIGDDRPEGAPKARRVLLCSGKVYYDLWEARHARGIDDVAILRFEQLYPLSDEDISAALAPYDAGTDVVWVQEEPKNNGAWWYLRYRFGERLVG